MRVETTLQLPVMLKVQQIGMVDRFCYLGSVATPNGSSNAVVSCHNLKPWTAFWVTKADLDIQLLFQKHQTTCM